MKILKINKIDGRKNLKVKDFIEKSNAKISEGTFYDGVLHGKQLIFLPDVWNIELKK